MEPPVTEYKRIAVDRSKHVFTLHGIDAKSHTVLRRNLRRAAFIEFFRKLPPTQIAMEACGGSHHWGRELQALGHRVALTPPQYVKPFVKRGKNDRNDAEAICTAAGPAGHGAGASQVGPGAGRRHAAQRARVADPATHPAGQRPARARRRVRLNRRQGRGRVARGDRQSRRCTSPAQAGSRGTGAAGGRDRPGGGAAGRDRQNAAGSAQGLSHEAGCWPRSPAWGGSPR